jgi:hypothetical protein
MVEQPTITKKIAWPRIEIRDNQVGMIWVECDDQGNQGDTIRLAWDELFEFGIEDWMIRCAIEENLEETDQCLRGEASVFYGVVEYPDISFETYEATPEIAEKLNSMGFEIIKGKRTQFAGGGSWWASMVEDSHQDGYVPENYVPDIPAIPDNPDMHIGDNVEEFSCHITHGQFMARPLIYHNPHNGAEYFFCQVCEKAGRKNPWHPYIMGNKVHGCDEQSVQTAISALGDGHSVYEIAKYCSEEFKGKWDKRKVLRICDKLSENNKITYSIETRKNREVKLVYLNRANH